MSCVLLFLLQYKVRKLRIKQNYCKKEIRHLYYLIEFLTIQHLRASFFEYTNIVQLEDSSIARRKAVF